MAATFDVPERPLRERWPAEAALGSFDIVIAAADIFPIVTLGFFHIAQTGILGTGIRISAFDRRRIIALEPDFVDFPGDTWREGAPPHVDLPGGNANCCVSAPAGVRAQRSFQLRPLQIRDLTFGVTGAAASLRGYLPQADGRETSRSPDARSAWLRLDRHRSNERRLD